MAEPVKRRRTRKPKEPVMLDEAEAILAEPAEPDTEPKPKRTRAPRAAKAKKVTVDSLIQTDSPTVSIGAVALRFATGARFGFEGAMNAQESVTISYHANRIACRAALPLIESVLSKVNLSLDETGQDVLKIGETLGAYGLRLLEPMIMRLFNAAQEMDDKISQAQAAQRPQPEPAYEPAPAPAQQNGHDEDSTRKANEASMIAWVDAASYGASEGE